MAGFGFNRDGVSRAWVVADRDAELERHVGEVLDELGSEPCSPEPSPAGPIVDQGSEERS